MKRMEKIGAKPKRAVFGNHHPGAHNIDARGAGFVDTVKAAGIPAEQMDVTEDPVKGADLLLAYLKRHSDANMLCTTAPFMTSFAIRAEELGIETNKEPDDLFLVSSEITHTALDHIEQGKVLFSTDQQQYYQGYLSVVLMYLHLKYGLLPPPLFSTGEDPVTAEMVPSLRLGVKEGYR